MYWRPDDAWVARFLGAAMILPGRVRSGVAECLLGRLPLAAGDDVPEGAADIVVRPEQITWTCGDGAAGPLATVAAVRFHGPGATVTLTVGGEQVEARGPSIGVPAPGDRVALHVAGTVRAIRA